MEILGNFGNPGNPAGAFGDVWMLLSSNGERLVRTFNAAHRATHGKICSNDAEHCRTLKNAISA